MTDRDRTFVWIIIGLAVALAAIPTLFGLAIRPSGHQFFGNSALNTTDPAVYYSYIEQGRHGALFMSDMFTSERYHPSVWQPLWTVVGLGAALFHVDSPTAFIATRFVGLIVFLLTIQWALEWLFPDQLTRRLALVLTAFAGGLEGLISFFIHWPAISQASAPDIWVAEAFTYLASVTSGHFLLVSAGIVFVLVSVERSWEEQSWRRIPLAGLVALLTLSIHPFHIVTWIVFWVFMTVWRWPQTGRFPIGYVGRYVAIIGFSLPAFILYGVQLVSDPITIGRAVQNIATTPTPWHTILGLGLLLPLALIGARFAWAQSRIRWLIFWAAAILVAIYLPVPFQRRLSQAIVVPLGWLAAVIVARWWSIRWRWSRPVVVAVLIVISTTGFAAIGYAARGYTQEVSQAPLRLSYLSPEYQHLIENIKHLPSDRAILSSIMNGNVIAGLASHHVYIGHTVETLKFQSKLRRLEWFFGQATANEQRDWLQAHRICYVLNGPREQTYGHAFQPALWTDLDVVWSGPTMTLYYFQLCR